MTASSGLNRASWALLVAALLVALLLGVLSGPSPAGAHGNAAIRVEPASAAPGDVVTVTGEEFEPNAEVLLYLKGLGGFFELARVQADADGAFTTQVTVPEARPGLYQVHAESVDATSSFDFSVLEPAPPPTATPAAAGTPEATGVTPTPPAGEMPEMEPAAATGEAAHAAEPEIENDRPTGETAVLAALLGVAGLTGLAVLWRTRRP